MGPTEIADAAPACVRIEGPQEPPGLRYQLPCPPEITAQAVDLFAELLLTVAMAPATDAVVVCGAALASPGALAMERMPDSATLIILGTGNLQETVHHVRANR
jgi:hypothetical protein